MTKRATSLRPPGRRAFSLIELSLVLVIITIVSAIALPRYGAAVGRYRAQSAARRIAGDLALAQAEAKAASASRKVTFNVKLNRYEVATATGTPYRVVSVGESGIDAKLDSLAIGGSTSLATITFDGYGMPDTGGTVTVSADGVTRTITINAYTGEAKWE